MAGWTNRGKFLMLNSFFRATGTPTTFYAALVTSANTPTADTNTLGELTQIAAGNGYTAGGIALARNSTDWDVLSEVDASDVAFVQAKNIAFTATGGSLPASGGAARWLIITTDEVTVDNRQVVAFLSLGADYAVSVGQTITAADAELRLTE